MSEQRKSDLARVDTMGDSSDGPTASTVAPDHNGIIREPCGWYRISRKAGRCANGAERDGGRVWHAVPVASVKAICGAIYGRQSAGWASEYGERVTCPVCARRLSVMRLATGSAFARWREDQVGNPEGQ